MSIDTMLQLLPELTLITFATFIYVLGAFFPGRQEMSWVAAGALIVAAGALARQSIDTPSGPVSVDAYAFYIRWLALGAGLILVLQFSKSASLGQTGEVLGTLLMAIAGLMLVGVSQDLIMLFLGLELISIPTYVLLYLGRRDIGSQEAAVKYFYLSILSSALLLYGFSFLYGASGTTRLDAMAEHLAAVAPHAQSVLSPAAAPRSPASVAIIAPLGMVLVLAGLGFKLALVPFHFYAPDVYQGATNGNAGLLSVLPKAAGLAALVRIGWAVLPVLQMDGLGWRLALIVAVLTMTLGNLLALWQENVRRIFAYSSIAHAGYLMIGVAVWFASPGGSFDGAAAALIYIALYAVATLGCMSVLVYLSSSVKQIDGIDELAGVGRTHPLAGVAMSICLLSLAGVPPAAGFWGKFWLFAGALQSAPQQWFIALAVVGALNAAIAAAYYLRLIGVMYFRAPLGRASAEGGPGAVAAMGLCSVIVVVLGLLPAPLITAAERASAALQPVAISRAENKAVTSPAASLSAVRP